MNTVTTLAAYATGLAVVFGGAVGVGHVVGPVRSASTVVTHDALATTEAGASSTTTPTSSGLAVAQDGYRLELLSAPTTAGRSEDLAFRLIGPDGEPVTRYTPEHEKDLHLIVVHRDGTGFQHLHPRLSADGTWTLPLTLPRAGSYKLFTDFRAADAAESLTLATDVTVAGPTGATELLPDEQRTATVDGYRVTVDGDLTAGGTSDLILTVSRDGAPVTDLEPYLGAYGHLVALRDGDLAYLHVHPEGPQPDGATGGPELAFAADVPSRGVYRLYLDFAHRGRVHTVALSLPAGEPGAAAEGSDAHTH